MASNYSPSLLNIPLEVRHLIFSYVAASDTRPELMLRYWFERKEIKEKRALLKANEEDEDEGEEEIEEDSEHEQGEVREGGGEYEADGSADTTTTAAVPAKAQGSTAADQTAQSTAVDASSSGPHVYTVVTMAAANATSIFAVGIANAIPPEASVAPPDQEQDDAEEDAVEDDEDVDSDEDNDNDDNDSEGEEAEDEDEAEDESGDESDNDTAMQPRTEPVITAHRKWRHIPKFMRITLCPPPVELLLASKDLNSEAKSWFYDVAVLRIEATGSFAHTSFFEEAFSQITKADFSPMSDIRRVEVTFVWDTTWLRSDRMDCAAAIFPALLRQRALFVTGILAQAPHLSQVTIHWHDSAQDKEAVELMNDVLMGFLSLPATVKIEPHYIAVGAKPYKKSIAGRRRVEFQRIVDNGLDRLF